MIQDNFVKAWSDAEIYLPREKSQSEIHIRGSKVSDITVKKIRRAGDPDPLLFVCAFYL